MFVFESLSSDKKIVYPDSGRPFSVSSINSLLQWFCFINYEKKKFTKNKEYFYTLNITLNGLSNIKMLNCQADDLSLPILPQSFKSIGIGDIPQQLNSFVAFAFSKKPQIVKGSMKLDNILYIMLLVKGEWQMIIDLPSIKAIISKISKISVVYDAEKRPTVKLQQNSGNLSIVQALRLLQKRSREDNNIDSWSNILELTESISIKAIPSSSKAVYMPDLVEFNKNLARQVVLDFNRGNAVSYYYTGAVSEFEYVIVFVNGRWFLLVKEEARKLLSASYDDSREQRLLQSFKPLTKTLIDDIIKNIAIVIGSMSIDKEDIKANAYLSLSKRGFYDLIELDNNFDRIKDKLVTFNLPEIETILLKIELAGKMLAVLFIGDKIYEVLSDNFHDKIDLNIELWSNQTLDEEINEAKAVKVEYIKYDIESSKINQLMQQEHISIIIDKFKRNEEAEKFGEFNQFFSAGSKTIIGYSAKTKRLMLMGDEFATMVFIYNSEVESTREIKAIIEHVLTPNKSWTAYEIVTK